MSETPFRDKNAYLSIFVSQDTITANLSYSHYTIGRHYVLSDSTYFDSSKDDIESQRFWDEYFEALSERFRWKLIHSSTSEISMANYIPFTDESRGISGITFAFHHDLNNRVKIQSVIHSYIPNAAIRVVNEDYLESFIPRMAEKMGYDDVLILNADLDKFDLFRFNNISTKNEEEKKKNKYYNSSTKIYWESKNHLINAISDKRFMAFSSINVGDSAVTNLWANYVLRPVNSSDNYDLHDLLRSFLTVQLVSMFNNNKKVMDQFGKKNDRSLLLVTGKMVNLLDKKEILIGLLDGLQLVGNFDLFLDRQSRLITLGEFYSMGINSKDYIVPDHTVIDIIDKVLVVEAPYKKKSRAILTGEILSEGKHREDVYVIGPGFMKFEIPNSESSTTVLTGKFVKNAYVEGLKDDVLITSSKEKGVVDNVFFDCRTRPVVYGPDARSNSSKLKVWVSE